MKTLPIVDGSSDLVVVGLGVVVVVVVVVVVEVVVVLVVVCDSMLTDGLK